ncbi:MAG: histidine phosphatase family protein [Pseudomonadales bacterium]|nr:histidine phosphatase family protein [Pseudomonadales bacterium]
MAQLYLVRHGKAASGFAGHRDPGLDKTGQQQALHIAKQLAPLGPLPIISSPLLRTRETALPLCELWNTQAIIEHSIAEIPTPTQDLEKRSLWLKKVMQDTWDNLDTSLHAWRDALVNYLMSLEEDCVLFSHFVAINVAVSYANQDPRLISFQPDNASCTILSNVGELRILELGTEANTKIN